MGRIRAKFRCLRVTEKWNEMWVIDLGPVMQGNSNSEENKKFWEASPSGECELSFWGKPEFKAGDYYYIDMDAHESAPAKDGSWKMGTISHHVGGSGGVEMWFNRVYDWQVNRKPQGLLNGKLTIGIEPEKVLAMFGEPGGIWNVNFLFAEESDGDGS